MRQTYVAGERLFVDYAGTTLAVIDPSTGAAQLFVAALGASNYTYAEATWTQGLADWIGSHTRTFAFIGAVPAMVVSDNLKAGVAKACFYEPAVNRPTPRWRPTTTPPSCRRGRTSRATRRLIYIAPHSGDCAAIEIRRAWRAALPP